MSLGLFQPGPTGQSNIEIIPEVPGNLKRSGSRTAENPVRTLGRNSVSHQSAITPLSMSGTAIKLLYEPSAKNIYPFRYSVMVSSAYPITPLISSNLALLYSPGPNALYIGPGFTLSRTSIWTSLGKYFFPIRTPATASW